MKTERCLTCLKEFKEKESGLEHYCSQKCLDEAMQKRAIAYRKGF